MARLIDVKFSMFFDRPAVEAATRRKERRILSGTGAFARQVMRRSMRRGPRKKKVRTSNRPPFAWAGDLKRNIFFGFEATSNSVVAGPRFFKNANTNRPVPKLLEFGGKAVIRTRGRRKRKARYRTFPFAAPVAPVAAKKMRDIAGE